MNRNANLFLLTAAIALGAGYWYGRPLPQSPPDAREAAVDSTQSASPRDGWPAIAARSAVSSPMHANASTVAANLPLGPFGVNVGELKRRVGTGDARAAKALADGYRRCRFFKPPQSQADLEKRAEDCTVTTLNLVDQIVDQVKDAARKQNVELGEIPEMDGADAYRQQLKAETGLASDCRGVDPAAAEGWLAWYERAAELGDTEAELGYWSDAFDATWLGVLDEIPRRKEVATAALQRSLARGDWRALVAIGLMLERGYLAEPDPFAAHAWFYAASMAPQQDIAVLPWLANAPLARIFTGNDTQTYLAGLLARTAAPLSAAQLAAAERIGRERFNRCCGGRHP